MLDDDLVCQVDHLFKAIGPTGGVFLAFRTHGVFPRNSVVSSLTDFPLLPTTSLFTGEPIVCIIPVVASCVPKNRLAQNLLSWRLVSVQQSGK